MSTVCGHPHGEGGDVRPMWTHVDRGRGVKNGIFCGRHKWMAPYLMLGLSLLSCLQQDVLLFIAFVFPLLAYLLFFFAFNIFGNGIYLVFNVYFKLCRRRMCNNFHVRPICFTY